MHIVQWCTLRFYMPILGYVKIRLNDIKPVCVTFYGLIIPWWLMTKYQCDVFTVTHVSGNFCCRQSTCQVAAPSSSTSTGVTYLKVIRATAASAFTSSPSNHRGHWGDAALEIAPLLFMSQQHTENKCETPDVQDRLFSMLRWSESV